MDLHNVIARQHGLISRAEARRFGLSVRQIERRTASGVWVPEQRGLYRDATHHRTWELRVRAAVKAVGGVAFGRCAAVLWGLGIFTEPPVEVLCDHRVRRSLREASVRRTTHITQVDQTVRRGIACTGIDRTLLDCAASVGAEVTERLLESALRQGLTVMPRVIRHLEQDGINGRPGTSVLRRVVEARGTAPVTLSEFSDRVVQLVRSLGLEAPLVEYQIFDTDGRFVLQADLAWPRQQKAVELDGLEWHFGRIETERDRRKRAKARAEGWRILELTWSMYDCEREYAGHLLRDFLGSRES